MTTKYRKQVKGKMVTIGDYIALDSKCSKKKCFVPFSGNRINICRLYELGQCKEI